MPQERRSYSKTFKAQIIAECAQPDTSIANVALTHRVVTPSALTHP
ncbi:transposase [Pseudomonas alliivorans]|nr:transposase [Pseudomonas alliivorans]MEE4994356.1 transposase [Pseudomonas alliivorans]MEE5025035.1 transposase [Pseudomonas alliivorans]MEE5077032.1 transposase [Pseudomonas alliivorans]MEE5159088.1 transposase [Pseudomonas alliivorans]